MKKRILQITNYMYPHLGGIEQVTKDILESINNFDEYEQKVICFNENASDGKISCNRFEDCVDVISNVEVVRCKCFAKISSQSLSLTYYRRLQDLMDTYKPDIIILHHPNPFVVFLLSRFYSRPFRLIVFWHLDITKQVILRKLFYYQTMRLLRRANQVVSTSPNYIEGSSFLKRFKEKCVVIPNCIRDERFFSEESDIMSKKIREDFKSSIVCFSIGRHVPYKGFSSLISLIKHVKSNCVFIIAGQGPKTEELKRQAQGCYNIHFVGKLSDIELSAWYKACDIILFPSISKNEAFGLALVEGMYFGKPAVTYSIPGSGVNYVSINGVTCIECPNKNEKLYADAVDKLAMDAELRMELGINAKKRVENYFLFETFKNNIHKLLSEHSI